MPEIWGDASFGGSEVTPYGGGFVRWRNGSVAWMARKLKFVPLSTCEAEVAAMVGMIKEGLFVVEIDTARHGCADQWESTGHY